MRNSLESEMATKQHYVQSCYLAGFVDPSSKEKEDPYLWAVDFEQKTVRKRAPKNVARIPGYYDIRDTQSLPQYQGRNVDKGFVDREVVSEIENGANAVIRKLREPKFQVTLEDRYHLAHYLGLQFARVPIFREASRAAETKRAQDWLRLIVQDKARVQRKLDEYPIKADGRQSALTPESIRDAVLGGKIRIAPPDNFDDYLLGLAMKATLDVSEAIFTRSWTFLHATGPETFFTSDNPVVLLTPDGKPSANLDERVEISFPISPSCMLSIHMESGARNRGIAVDTATVYEINKRMLPTAKRYVFCSTKKQGEWALSQRLGSS